LALIQDVDGSVAIGFVSLDGDLNLRFDIWGVYQRWTGFEMRFSWQPK